MIDLNKEANKNTADILLQQASQETPKIPRTYAEQGLQTLIILMKTLAYQNKVIIELLEELKPTPSYPNCQCPK